MKTDALSRGLATLFAIILISTLLAVPALAGNSVTITGEVIPSAPPVADFSADPTSGHCTIAGPVYRYVHWSHYGVGLGLR